MPKFSISEISKTSFAGTDEETGLPVFTYEDTFKFNTLFDVKRAIDILDTSAIRTQDQSELSLHIRQLVNWLLWLYDRICAQCISDNNENIELHQKIDAIKQQILRRGGKLIEEPYEVSTVTKEIDLSFISTMKDVISELDNTLPTLLSDTHPLYLVRESISKLDKYFETFDLEHETIADTNIYLQYGVQVLEQQLAALPPSESVEMAPLLSHQSNSASETSYTDGPLFNFKASANVKQALGTLDFKVDLTPDQNGLSLRIRPLINRLLDLHALFHQKCAIDNNENIQLHENITAMKQQILQRGGTLITAPSAAPVKRQPDLAIASSMVNVMRELRNEVIDLDNAHPLYFVREDLDNLNNHLRTFVIAYAELTETNIKLQHDMQVLSQQLASLPLAESAGMVPSLSRRSSTTTAPNSVANSPMGMGIDEQRIFEFEDDDYESKNRKRIKKSPKI